MILSSGSWSVPLLGRGRWTGKASRENLCGRNARGLSWPLGLFYNLERRRDRGCVLHHVFNRAIFLLGNSDRFADSSGVHAMAGHNMVNSYCHKHLGRPLRLVGLHAYFVSGHALPLFISQNRDHVERGTPGQRHGDQFDWLGSHAPWTSSKIR